MIKSFINDVKRTLGEVLIKNDFKIVTTVSKNDYIMFAKRYSEELAVYVRCTDNRSHGHNVDVDYFFTPVNSPDDSIELFGIGIKINIISINKKHKEQTINLIIKIIKIECYQIQ